MNNDSITQNDQFVISYELLQILYSLLKYEDVELSKLIRKSFAKRLHDKKNKKDLLTDMEQNEEMQNSVIEFFNFLEEEALDLADEEATKYMGKEIIKDIEHVDPEQVNSLTVKNAIAKKARRRNKESNSELRIDFLKELLKQWKPEKEKDKKLIIN